MLLMGVTQRSEMRRHINVYVEENFPDVSKLDTSFYPTDQCLSSIMYRSMILHRHSHMDQDKVLQLVTFVKLFITKPRLKIFNLLREHDSMVFKLLHIWQYL